MPLTRRNTEIIKNVEMSRADSSLHVILFNAKAFAIIL